ncbi:hypothetical protein INR49_019824, partial [Caranx melampygus]
MLVGRCKMDIRVASILLLMVSMAAAHGERYVVKKLVKAAPYHPVKSQGRFTIPLKSHNMLNKRFQLQLQVNLDLQVSLAPRDLLALLAPQVRMPLACLDPKDPLDPLELLAAQFLASLDPLVDLANLEAMVHLVRRETLEPLALRDLGEPQELLEALDPLASLLLANPDLLVLRVIEGWEFPELRVRQDLKDLWAHQENQVQPELESQEKQVHLESQESQVCQVNQVRTVLPVCPAQWAPKATRALLEPLVLLESPVMESQVQMERREREEPQVAQELQVQRVISVIQDILVLLVLPAQLVLLGLRVQQDSQVSLVLLAPKVTQVHLELRDLKETREIRDHRVSKENRVTQEQLVPLDPEEPLEPWVRQVLLVLMVPQVPEDPLVLKVLLVLLVLRDTQVSLVLLALLVWLLRVSLDLRVPLVCLVSLVLMEKLAQLVLLVPQVLLYNKGFLDQMSGSAVLLLDEQDTVYVQIPDDEANGVFAAENVHCSFSGFLIAS